MSASWRTVSGRSLILLALFLFCDGIGIQRATQYANAALSERTTDAHVFLVEHHIFHHLRSNFYSCNYNFSIDGSFYIGLSDCPQGIADDAAKGKYSYPAGASTGADATVYYNPADPSVNSLLEFSTASEKEYQDLMLPIGITVLIVLSIVFGAALEATKNRGNGPIFVDAKGTFVDPDEVDFASEFGSVPVGGGAVATDAATSERAVREANFAVSHGLRELYLDVIKHVHPDHASNESDRALRERLTKDANIAFERGDDAALRRVLEEYESLAPQR
ncbi:MAG: DUF3592 domain-containing protein [Terracidiphilus sp.]|jgi:hypothetical protein